MFPNPSFKINLGCYIYAMQKKENENKKSSINKQKERIAKPSKNNSIGGDNLKSENKMQINNPLHGIKLADILAFLIEKYSYEELGRRIKIRCFTNDPSLKSCLKFLRRTPWAREKVERLYLKTKR